MHDALFSPYLVPVIGILGGIAYFGISAWKKVKEQELEQERELRMKELELRGRSQDGTSNGH